jgi:hypothetical protein
MANCAVTQQTNFQSWTPGHLDTRKRLRGPVSEKRLRGPKIGLFARRSSSPLISISIYYSFAYLPGNGRNPILDVQVSRIAAKQREVPQDDHT